MKPSDLRYLEKIQTWYNTNGILPTYSEVCALCGFKSKNAAFKLMQRLMKEEYLKKIGSRLAPLDKFFI